MSGPLSRAGSVISSRTQTVKFLQMSNDEISDYYHAQKLDEILPTLQTGDVLLFRGMGTVSGAIKKLTFCNFSHIGMIVRDPSPEVRRAYHVPDSETETVFCWEANMSTHPPRPGGGTHLPTLRWKFERALVRECEQYVLCVRKLVLNNPTTDLNPSLSQFMVEMSTRSYEMERSELLGGIVQINRLSSSENLKSVFCSELIAAAYKRMGLLKEKVNPSVFVPRTFTSDQRLDGDDLKLVGAKLDREIRIISEKSIEELKSNPIYTNTPVVELGEPSNQQLIIDVQHAELITGAKVFIRIEYRTTKLKTKTKSGTSLVWNESNHQIPLSTTWKNDVAHVDNFVSFTLFSKATIGADDYIGRAYVDISKINLPFSGPIPINSGGLLHVEISLKE